MATELREFLAGLATDAKQLADFMADADAVMEKAELAEDDRTLLKSGNLMAIQAKLAGVPVGAIAPQVVVVTGFEQLQKMFSGAAVGAVPGAMPGAWQAAVGAVPGAALGAVPGAFGWPLALGAVPGAALGAVPGAFAWSLALGAVPGAYAALGAVPGAALGAVPGAFAWQ